MRPPGKLVALALLALAAGASGLACPELCACSETTSLDLTCARPQGDGSVRLEGERTRYLNVLCSKDTKNFTCDDIPEFDFGRNSTLEALGFVDCPLASLSIACLARRVRARRVHNLTISYAPDGPRLLPRNVEGLEGVKRLFLKGREEIDEVSIPTDALALLPALERLTMQGARAQLAPGALGRLRSLARLEVSMAGLRRVPAGALADLPALAELSLFRNDIEDIAPDTFQKLPALATLDVSRNRLAALDGATLAAGCPRLRALHAFANPLRALRPLEPLRHLEKLEIFDCDLEKPLQLSPHALAGLPRLAHVQLRSCHIQLLPADLLTGSGSLLTLDLSGNSLRELPEKLLADQNKLEELDLSENQLESLPKELLWGARNLRQLNLDRNHLVELPDRFADGLPLRRVSAAHNRLGRLGASSFAGAGALEELDLSHNQLDNAPEEGQYASFEQPSPFNALLRLRTLDLSHNRLRALYADVAQVLLRLAHLDMSHNRIGFVTYEDTSLNFLSANVTVDLRDNNITTVLLPPPLTGGTGGGGGGGARVLLARNPLTCDCRLLQLARRQGRGGGRGGGGGGGLLPAVDAGDAECAAPASLRGRRFAGVDLNELVCHIPAEHCVPGCRCLLRADVLALDCDAPFDSLPDQFANFNQELKLRFAPISLSWVPLSIRALNLSDLNMTEVPRVNLSAIRELDLRGNALSGVPVGILRANVSVMLSRNRLACDCWHADGIRQLQASSALVRDYMSVKCVDGFPARNVDADRLCRTFALVSVGVALAFLGLASILATVLFLRYSLHVKVFLHSRGWCGCWVREEDIDGDKKFDAFITYAERDKGFVHDILQPGLESGPKPFKLCIHHRDWIAGEWIPAQIAQSVDQSRRTIVVLSKNFLDSMWARLEFRAANMSAVKEKRSRVIVILLEDVAGHEDIDAELKAYLATNTYLRWGDPWFWEKLRYALPHRAEEVRMRKRGGRLARIMAGTDKSKGDGPLDVKFAPNGKIFSTAIEASPDRKMSDVKALHI